MHVTERVATPLLRVRDLTVAHPRGPVVLEHVDLDLDGGEVVALVGPNGAGKSTLLRAIVGELAYTGRVELAGHHCHHRRDHLVAAYVPQRSLLDLDFPITVGQLVLSSRRRFLRLGSRPGPGHRASATDALRRVGLQGLGQRPLATLSGGQLQRALIARALAQEAQLLLLDETLSGVDAASADELLDVFHSLAAEGTSLLLATHDHGLVERRFDRCIRLGR